MVSMINSQIIYMLKNFRDWAIPHSKLLNQEPSTISFSAFSYEPQSGYEEAEVHSSTERSKIKPLPA